MIDARGLSCPMPVVMVQNEVKKNNPDSMEVVVDSMVCVENITRYGNTHGFEVASTKEGEEYTIRLTKKNAQK